MRDCFGGGAAEHGAAVASWRERGAALVVSR